MTVRTQTINGMYDIIETMLEDPWLNLSRTPKAAVTKTDDLCEGEDNGGETPSDNNWIGSIFVKGICSRSE